MSQLALDLGDAYKLTPETGSPTVASTFSTPADLINTILPNIYILAGVLLLFFFIGAGWKMIMNPQSSKSAEEGKKSLGYAVGGFILLIAVYWIVQIIQVVTGAEILGN